MLDWIKKKSLCNFPHVNKQEIWKIFKKILHPHTHQSLELDSLSIPPSSWGKSFEKKSICSFMTDSWLNDISLVSQIYCSN